MSDEKKGALSEPELTAPKGPPGKSPGSSKLVAVIIALLVVIGVLGGLLATHYLPTSSNATTATLSSKVGAISQGSTYSTNITASGTFKNITIYYGDGSSSLIAYSGKTTVQVNHTYANPGEYYIFADINYGSSQGYYLEPVKVSPEYPSIDYAYRAMAIDPSSSSPQLLNNLTDILGTGAHMSLTFLPQVGGGKNQIVSQQLTFSNQSGTVSQKQVPYLYNTATHSYELSTSGVTYAAMQNGMYVLEVNTTTAPVNTTQTIQATVTSSSTMSFTAGKTFTTAANTELAKNLSGVTMGFERTNMTFGENTTMNYTGSTVIFLGSATNLTVSYGSLAYKTVTGKTGSISKGQTVSLNSSTVLTAAAGGANLTYNLATMAQLNNSATTATLFGKNPTIATMNATTITFQTTAKNVTVTTMLQGTATVPLNNGEYNHSAEVTTTYFEDFPVVPSVKQQKSNVVSFTNSEPNLPGGYTTLDPSTAYYQADTEILNSLLMPLVTYNGSSTDSFEPMVAKQLPSSSNGGINSNYVNKTTKTPWGTTYQYNVTPGENYTFVINSKLKFANGDSVTAWDVMYSITRTLLFISGSPGTAGWILGQYMLPGAYYKSNSFYNITTNMTVDNSTNSITFHFQQPMNPSFAFQILSSDGTWIEDSNWYVQHGAKITWTTQGFKNYEKYGNLNDYNTYVQNHVMPDGPYKISYIIPGSEVSLVANPDFVSPGPWYPAASINQVNILYSSSNQQAYLLLSSKQAQNAFLPTSYWNQTRNLANNGVLKIYGFPSLSINFYNFNLNINTKTLTSLVKSANVPQYFFTNPNVRKAFAYAFNYSLYFSKQVGNEIYNTTFFSPYVGMLPPGMLYNQTAQDLISAGTNVVNSNGKEPFQIKEAQKYMSYYINGTATTANHDTASIMNVKYVNGQVQFNGSNLVVPIFVPVNDPTNTAAASTWASDMQKVLPGATFPIFPIPLTQLFGAYSIQGQNPMPISWGGWNPDYPFPTDYLQPMAMPINGSFYMGGASYTPYSVGNMSHSAYNLSEAAFMKQELRALDNASNNGTNPPMAKYWFHVTNGMVVNSTTEVYTGQTYRYFTISSNINGNDIRNYQQNVMYGGKGVLLYNLLSYNATS